MAEMVGQVHAVTRKSYVECELEFWIAAKDEFQGYLLGEMTSDDMHTFLFKMTIKHEQDGNYSMSPDDSLSECMDVYHEHEYSDNLNPQLRRLWKTAYIADNITRYFIDSKLNDFWDSEKEY